jgi:hypothetical protein
MSKLVTLVAALAVVTAGPAAALNGGVPDGNGHPNVGLLTFDVDGPGPAPPFALCTGFVVSDAAFVTAAHCITVFPEGAVQWGATLEPGGPTSPVYAPGFLWDDFPFAVGAAVTPALRAVVHPQHRVGWREANDVAIVLFPAGTFAGVTPVELPEEGVLDDLAALGGLHGQSFRLVGYGTERRQDGGRPRLFAPGYRQTASAPFQALTPMHLRLQLTSAATGGAGLCAGDSGSPQFLGESNLVVSLLTASSSSESCTGAQAMQRLDTASVRAFLDEYLD